MIFSPHRVSVSHDDSRRRLVLKETIYKIRKNVLKHCKITYQRNHLQKRKKRPETLQNNISEKDVHRGALIEWDEWDGWICGRAVQFIASYWYIIHNLYLMYQYYKMLCYDWYLQGISNPPSESGQHPRQESPSQSVGPDGLGGTLFTRLFS